MGLNPKTWKGRIENKTMKTLWIVETDTGSAVAHKLERLCKTPKNIDADGVKTVDGTPISGHTSWWKIGNTEWASIKQREKDLVIESFPFFSIKPVKENEFGVVRYDPSPLWGDCPKLKNSN